MRHCAPAPKKPFGGLVLRNAIETALKGKNARYIEVRAEEAEGTNLVYRGKSLDDVSKASVVGGCVRALDKGGWGFASFNNLSEINEKVEVAVSHAKHVGGTRVELAKVTPHDQTVEPHLGEDPRQISIAEKKKILDNYVQIILGISGVQTANIGYSDSYRKTYFANSEGAFVQQERIDVNMRLSAMARANSDVQQSGISLGSLGDFSFVRSLESEAEEVARRAVDLLSAPQVKGGPHTVILDPVLAGVFIHEAFGHLSEADHVYEEKRLQEIMYMGRRFGGNHLNVVDGAALPQLRGSYAYDDEGTPSTKTHLIREGLLVGRLHSRETAAAMGENPTGNARAINYRFPPIVRMTNTYIEPGNATFQDLLSGVKEGVYARNWYGGMTSMEMFTFSAGEAYMIRNGKIEELLRPILLTGNLFETLNNLDAIGNDLEMNQGGGCGKGGQSPLPVSNGSPHIRIQNCLVGGA